jgi:hypothetical protein
MDNLADLERHLDMPVIPFCYAPPGSASGLPDEHTHSATVLVQRLVS